MKEIALLMKELEHQLKICNRCGICQAVCPLFQQTRIETDVARGKIAILEGLAEEMFKGPKGVYKRIYHCLLCGSCEANCPSGVKVIEIFIKARVILTNFIGLSLTKKIILRIILTNPYFFDMLIELLMRIQQLVTKSTGHLLKTSCTFFVSPLIQNHNFKTIASLPFLRIVKTLNSYPGKSKLKVAFFVGCLVDKIFPKIAEAVIDVLNYHEVGIFISEDQGCCGAPAIASGDTVTFSRLVRRNLELLDNIEFDYLVTACATCTYMIKTIWPVMIKHQANEIRSKIEALAEKTLDISQFLVSKLELKNKNYHNNKSVIVTYHDPCHLLKSLKISSEPRNLIKANSKYTLKEMNESDLCCGFGLSFHSKNYNISDKIGKRKRDNINLTKCSVVSTGCPACMIQIEEILSKLGDPIVVKHPVTIYSESLKNNNAN